MQWHLEKFSSQVALRTNTVHTVHQASWHATKKLAVPENILIELNPVENIWQFMCENWLSNRILAVHSPVHRV